MKAIYMILVNGEINRNVGMFATLKRAKECATALAAHPTANRVELLKLREYNGQFENEDCGEILDWYATPSQKLSIPKH